MASSIGERRIQEFIADLIPMEHIWPNGRNRRISPKTVRNIVGVLRSIMGKKVSSELNLRFPEIAEKDQRRLSPDEMRQIVNAATGQWKVMFATHAGTGMRCGESSGLLVEDLNLSMLKICVRRGIYKGKKSQSRRRKAIVLSTLIRH
jgi:integrase